MAPRPASLITAQCCVDNVTVSRGDPRAFLVPARYLSPGTRATAR
ncbi:hypothetical protein ACFFX0_32895 [Citricoccus parietis]|uniref:Uncharacterized protein n=1 Tax=Citricoccus parietis TaxID=592307 RepID=A0ABV5G9U4_9MICC